MAEQGGDLQDLELSSLESPSARLAVELYQAERGSARRPAFKIDQIQQPDPRLPSGPAEFVLWRYDGVDPQPTLDPPSSTVAQAVGVLASRPFDAGDWADVGRKIGGRLGAKSVRDLLATMTHPPRRPAPFSTWNWLHHAQVAAAFIIAGLDAGWEGSLRKRTLFSLAYGPMDWTVEAAIIALTQIVREQPDTAPDIAALYRDLFNALPMPGGVPYLHALSICAAYLPRRHSLALLALLNSKAGSVLNAGDHYWRGVKLARENQPEAAIAELDQAIRLMPHFAAAYHQRGLARTRRGDNMAAIDDYTEAIRLNPKDAGYYHNRAIARDRLGDLPGALADFEAAIRLDPADADCYAGRGVIRGKMGDTNAALADFDQAVHLNPNLASAYLNRGMEHYKQGDHRQAVAEYSEAIRLDPRSTLAYSNRAGARCELGDYAGAIADCDAALQIDPGYASAYANRGYARLKAGDYRRSIADSDQAIRFRPHAYFYHNRGQAYAALGDRRRALADYQETLRLMPDHPEAAEMRAKIAEWSKGK